MPDVVVDVVVRKHFKIHCRVSYRYESGEDGLKADLYIEKIEPLTVACDLADAARAAITDEMVEDAIRTQEG